MWRKVCGRRLISKQEGSGVEYKACPTLEWETTPALLRAEEMSKGSVERRFRLVARDLKVLESLLHYDYLTGRHLQRLAGFRSRAQVADRLAELAGQGLVARCRIRVASGRAKFSEYVYALRRLGAEALVCEGKMDERDFKRWRPVYRQMGRRLSVPHQLETADFCLAALEEADRRGMALLWRGSHWAHQFISSYHAGGHPLAISPDAVLLGGKAPLLVEMERSGSVRLARVREKLGLYRRYFKVPASKAKYNSRLMYVLYVMEDDATYNLIRHLAMDEKLSWLLMFNARHMAWNVETCGILKGDAKSVDLFEQIAPNH